MELCEVGCENLIGAIIKEALDDYIHNRKKLNSIITKRDKIKRKLKRLLKIKPKDRKEEYALQSNYFKVYSDKVQHHISAKNFLFSRELDVYLSLLGVDVEKQACFIRRCATGEIKWEKKQGQTTEQGLISAD